MELNIYFLGFVWHEHHPIDAIFRFFGDAHTLTHVRSTVRRIIKECRAQSSEHCYA